MKRWSLILAALMVAGTVAAQEKKPSEPSKAKISAEVGKPGGVYASGEKMVFSFTVTEPDGKPAAGKKVRAFLYGDKSVAGRRDLTTDANGKVSVEVEQKVPGSIRCVLYYGKGNAAAGAVVDPFKIQPARKKPADFDAYWNKLKAEIDKAPVDAKLTQVDVSNEKLNIFELELPCPGSKMPVRGYFVTPKNAKVKSLPALLSVHGAGVRSSNKPVGGGAGMIMLDINAHGIPNGQPKEFYEKLRSGELKGYPYFGMDHRDTVYFRDMFLRVYRALQFLKSRPEWDGKTLIAVGGSQGGGQALAAGGLDPQVSCVVAYVSAICDHGGTAVGRESGWPRFSNQKVYREAPEKCAVAADYIDAVNFARNIQKADVYMTTGLIDGVCVPSSVCSAFNAIPSEKKEMFFMPQTGHGGSRAAARRAGEFQSEHIRKMKNTK